MAFDQDYWDKYDARKLLHRDNQRQNLERDYAIVYQVIQKGRSLKEVGASYSITTERVRSVVNHWLPPFWRYDRDMPNRHDEVLKIMHEAEKRLNSWKRGVERAKRLDEVWKKEEEAEAEKKAAARKLRNVDNALGFLGDLQGLVKAIQGGRSTGIELEEILHNYGLLDTLEVE